MNDAMLDYLQFTFLLFTAAVAIIAIRSITGERALLLRILQLEQQVDTLEIALTKALNNENTKGERILLLEGQVRILEQENLNILRRLHIYEGKELIQ